MIDCIVLRRCIRLAYRHLTQFCSQLITVIATTESTFASLLCGTNSRTGSSWNQTSQTYGNTTQHTGRASNGNSWNSTQTEIGGTTYYNGTDSNGNSFNCSKSEYYSNC